MKLVRKIHFWLGTFFAPAIIFFALTGVLQLFGLHEGPDGIALVGRLAQIHKSQIVGELPPRPPRREPPPGAGPDGDRAPRDGAGGPPRDGAGGPPHVDAPDPARAPGPRPAPPPRAWLLVIFFALMSVSLIGSSVLGVYMAFQYKRDRRVILGLLAAGTILPLLFALV